MGDWNWHIYTQLSTKQLTNNDLQYSIGNPTQHSAMRKDLKKSRYKYTVHLKMIQHFK